MMHHNHMKMIDDDNMAEDVKDKWWHVAKMMKMMHHNDMNRGMMITRAEDVKDCLLPGMINTQRETLAKQGGRSRGEIGGQIFENFLNTKFG